MLACVLAKTGWFLSPEAAESPFLRHGSHYRRIKPPAGVQAFIASGNKKKIWRILASSLSRKEPNRSKAALARRWSAGGDDTAGRLRQAAPFDPLLASRWFTMAACHERRSVQSSNFSACGRSPAAPTAKRLPGTLPQVSPALREAPDSAGAEFRRSDLPSGETAVRNVSR